MKLLKSNDINEWHSKNIDRVVLTCSVLIFVKFNEINEIHL